MSRRGFTIIEVTLFIAISAALFVSLAAGSGLNVARQRYNSSVQSYTEFLRRLYSEVENVENDRSKVRGDRQGYCTVATAAVSGGLSQSANSTAANGRTNCAVYGRIAVFNERRNNSDAPTDNIYTYDIIGDIVDNDHALPSSIGNPISALAYVHAEFISYERTAAGTCVLSYAGNDSFFVPDWSSYIETTTKGQRYSGAVMVVRSPADGTIHTYVLDLNAAGYRISDVVGTNATYGCASIPLNVVKNAHAYLADYFGSATPKFTATETNFCVASDDTFAYAGRRRNVRLKADGSNSSAVELIEFDSGDNKCL